MFGALINKWVNDFSIFNACQSNNQYSRLDRQAKPKLFRKMQNGEIRVFAGRTEKAGTGITVQRKVIAMQHWYIPWKPSEPKRKNDLSATQGNVLAKEGYENKGMNYI